MSILGWTSPEEVKEIKAELTAARKVLDTAIAAHIKEEQELQAEITALKEQTINLNEENKVLSHQIDIDQQSILELADSIVTLQKQLDYANSRLTALSELERAMETEARTDTPTTAPPVKTTLHRPQKGTQTRGGGQSA